MKTLIKLLGINPQEVGQENYDHLITLYPEGASPRSFTCELFEDDIRLHQILEFLHTHGCTPWKGFVEIQPGQFWMRAERVYEQADYEQAAYFVPRPVEQFMPYDIRTADDLLRLESTLLQPEKQIGFVGWASVVVTNALRLRLQQAQLRRLSFRETVIEDNDEAEERYAEGVEKRQEVFDPFWELTSDLILPPMSPDSKFVDHDGQPFIGDLSKGCFLYDGFLHEPEPHYLAGSLEAAAPFDLALTHERFGNYEGVSYRRLIASKGFYNFCVSNHLKMNWIPVR